MREIITSRQNPQIKEICALADKKHRRQMGLFVLEGQKLFTEALENGIQLVWAVVRMPASEPIEVALSEAIATGRLREEQMIRVSESVFEKLTAQSAPEGILAVARFPEALHTTGLCAEEWDGKRLLIAEALRDPGNLGTVIRSCAALGIDGLILGGDCADLYNPKTVRSAMGALFRLPIVTVGRDGLPEAIHALRGRGRRVLATALHRDASVIGVSPLRAGDCFVIGNEGHGLSEEVIAACDGCAVIPMREGNESLNAAAAAAICIWETVRGTAER